MTEASSEMTSPTRSFVLRGADYRMYMEIYVAMRCRSCGLHRVYEGPDRPYAEILTPCPDCGTLPVGLRDPSESILPLSATSSNAPSVPAGGVLSCPPDFPPADGASHPADPLPEEGNIGRGVVPSKHPEARSALPTALASFRLLIVGMIFFLILLPFSIILTFLDKYDWYRGLGYSRTMAGRKAWWHAWR